MSTFTVALLQMSGCGMGQEASLDKGDAYCRRAAAAGAERALDKPLSTRLLQSTPHKTPIYSNSP